MLKYEKKIIEFCEKHIYVIFALFIVGVTLFLKYKMFNNISGDYELFLSKWFDSLKENGGIYALKSYIGDYNAPYVTLLSLLTYLPIKSLYLIKILSVIFDYVLAFSSGLLVKELVTKNKKYYFLMTFIIVSILPNVLLNSAMWAQCDSIYASFMILSLYFLVKEKYIKSFIMLGIAFAFKLQFIFILPLYLVLYFTKKKFSLLHFLILPITNIVLCLPALIIGNSLSNILSVYFNQTNTYSSELVLNFPNIWNIFPAKPDMFYIVGELLLVIICATMLLYIIMNKVKWNKEKIILLGLWFLIIVTYILPGMHERYLFVGEILSVIYFIAYKKYGYVALFINMCSLITYSVFLNNYNFQYMTLFSIIYLIIIMIFTNKVLIELKNIKKVEEV